MVVVITLFTTIMEVFMYEEYLNKLKDKALFKVMELLGLFCRGKMEQMK